MPSLDELKRARAELDANGSIPAFARTAISGSLDRQWNDENGRLQEVERRAKEQSALVDPVKRRLEMIKGAPKLEMEAGPVRSTAPLPQYERQRQQLQAQYSQGLGTQNSAIQRRFAAMGALNSGSAIKQMQLAQEKADQQRNDMGSAINAQEGQAQEAQFLKDKSDVAGRNFNREVANSENDFKAQLSGFDAASKLAQLDLQYKDFQAGRDDAAQSAQLYAQQLAAQNQGGGFFDALGGIVGAGVGAFTGGAGGAIAGNIFGSKK